MASPDVRHATLTFERLCEASVAGVFAAYADPVARAAWGAPSDTAAFLYDAADFRVGGRDVFRCGAKDDPRFHGVTTYLDIVPDERIVALETVETEGRRLSASLITTEFAPAGGGCRVSVTVQLVSFDGEGMVQGTEFGNNAALDHLVEAMRA